MTITVSVKGQMVIPSKIREKYNIKPQMKVELIDKGNEIVIIPLPKDPVKDSRGILKGISTGELIKFRREERKKEEQKYRRKYGISP
jgi:AbrB family looped-hinge helix DNA binding protein